MKSPLHVAVTGAAGQIGYSLLFRIASGAMFGPDQPVVLHLIEIAPALPALEGVKMELDDCAFPLLQEVIPTADLAEGFRGVNWALLVGSVPRKAGMERKDLLSINGKIFTGQGQAIAANAAPDVRVLVVGNPCNTNCLIAMNNARDVPSARWFAMTRLDENRAKAQLAQKAGVPVTDVTNLAIWGNHSATQYPDFYNAKISGQPATEIITDHAWLEGTFISTVQQRGAAIIKARGLSSAASAANAVVDTVHSLVFPTPAGDWNSVAVCSPDNGYGVETGLITSFPTRTEDGRFLADRAGLAGQRFQPVAHRRHRRRTQRGKGAGGRSARQLSPHHGGVRGINRFTRAPDLCQPAPVLCCPPVTPSACGALPRWHWRWSGWVCSPSRQMPRNRNANSSTASSIPTWTCTTTGLKNPSTRKLPTATGRPWSIPSRSVGGPPTRSPVTELSTHGPLTMAGEVFAPTTTP